MKKNIFLIIMLFVDVFIFAQTEFLNFYNLEDVAYEQIEYHDGFLRQEDIDNKDYETCRIYYYKNFSLKYYYNNKAGNENAMKIFNRLFSTGDEMCLNFDTYKIKNDVKVFLIFVGYTATRFIRYFYIFDITDKNNIYFYRLVSELFFVYQMDEIFFGKFKNKLCFFKITKDTNLYKNNPQYYFAPYIIENNEIKEYTDKSMRYRVYFDFDFSGDKGLYNIRQSFSKFQKTRN